MLHLGLHEYGRVALETGLFPQNVWVFTHNLILTGDKLGPCSHGNHLVVDWLFVQLFLVFEFELVLCFSRVVCTTCY